LRRKCVLKHVIESNIEGTRRGGKGSKQLLDDLKGTRGYWKLKGKALDHTVEKKLRTCRKIDYGMNK
jgi:hypothetical protein